MNDVTTMPTYEQAEKICQDFANRHTILFIRFGECGFGRDCSGFNRDGKWIDYNPTRAVYKPGAINSHDFQPVPEFCKTDLTPDGELVPNAYHKHDCLAVLHGTSDPLRAFSEDAPEPEEDPNDPNMQSAVIQLALWVQDMERIASNYGSELFVARYSNGYQGMQTLLSGSTSYAIGVR
jgi:hypothetical protein